MAHRVRSEADIAQALTLALIASSNPPLMLLDGNLVVIAVSTSFGEAFGIEPSAARGRPVFELGGGEWATSQLGALLRATASGYSDIGAYEMDLDRNDHDRRCLVLSARKLDYGEDNNVRILLTVSDVIKARVSEKIRDHLARERVVLLGEVHNRIANSLQIIASVLLQNARAVQSSESRAHLHDAHHRLMSVAAVQEQLAMSRHGDVELRPYLTGLCHSLGASMIYDHNQLSIGVMADSSKVKADVSVSLGLIVTELVINALKHAFPDHREGKITVSYLSRGLDWTLSVSDNGIGMPKSPNKIKIGLGTSIVQALARQLHADVAHSGASLGTAVSIAHSEAASVGADTNSRTERAIQ